MVTFKPPGQCPACGEWVPRHAAECDCCGAGAGTGWTARDNVYDGVDLPDDTFDYDEFIASEFGEGKKKPPFHPVWWWVAVVLLIAMGYALLMPLWR